MTCRNFNQTKTLASLVRLALLIIVLAAMVAFMGAGGRPAQANALTSPPDANAPLNAPAMLQFTSGGHILGFQPDSVYLAGLDHALSVQFVGARRVMPQAGPAPAQSGLKAGPLEAGAPPLSRVTYPNLWPGISLTYEAQAGSLAKSTYLVAPGADPGQIHLRYNTPVTRQPDGSLSFAFASGRLTEAAPVAWQEIGGRRVPIAVAFSARGRSEIGFAVGPYNRHYPLIIDPSYQWHTFYGSSSADESRGIAVDDSGNIYVSGWSDATWDGPGATTPRHTHSGGQDIVVVKLNSSGTYQWHTFYGSSNTDYGTGIAVDSSGNAYVTGYVLATWDGPGSATPLHAHSGNADIVVVKLNSNGDYQWHTFYGSSNSDMGWNIVVHSSGNVYITGESSATWNGPNPTDIPRHTYSGTNDIVTLKLDSNGDYLWHTFYGSNSNDTGRGIALDGSGNVYITGASRTTWVGPNPADTPRHAHSGGDDIVILKLNSNGDYLWHTFYGHSGYDFGYGIVVEGNGNVYVSGRSDATWNGPTPSDIPRHAHSGGGDIVVVKLNSSGAYQWHTFYGSSNTDYGYGIAADSSGNTYVSVFSMATWDGPDSAIPLYAHSGGWDIAVVKLNSSGTYQWHTFYGSSSADWGLDIAVDGSGNAYVSGYSEATWNGPDSALPRHTHSGGKDIVVVKTAPPPEIAVLGNGQEIINGSAIPSLANHTNFGSVNVPGGAVTRTFTISNSGSVDLTLTGTPAVTLTGASHFSITQQPASPVVSNTTTTFAISFAPTTTGTHTATVSIANNDPNETPYTFAIQGIGATGDLYLPLIIKN